MSEGKRRQWLFALFLLACVLFFYPLLAVFNRPVLVFGAPILTLFLFCAWALIVGLTLLIHERRR